jgi:hypothetical protein
LSGMGRESLQFFLRKSTKLNLKPVFESGEGGILIDLALLGPDFVATGNQTDKNNTIFIVSLFRNAFFGYLP